MLKSLLKSTGAIAALATALTALAIPAQAQDRGRRSDGWGQQQAAPQQGQRGPRQQRAERTGRGWGQGQNQGAFGQGQARVQTPRPPVSAEVQARGGYGAQGRDRGYGATTRGDWAAQRRQNDPRAQAQAEAQANVRGQYRGWGAGSRDNAAERREDARETRRDYGRGYAAGQTAGQRSDRDAYRQGYRQGQQQERREDWRDDRRDQQRAYSQGYRAGDRSDDRYGRDHRRWDSRGWRNDSRYDWYRYRASNRSLFSLGRYYAPYGRYSYSRVNIGFRLGSPFYANRYWINDPWRYRLPDVYGPYRWIRYYDDALLVDVYSGEVVDVINNFFW